MHIHFKNVQRLKDMMALEVHMFSKWSTKWSTYNKIIPTPVCRLSTDLFCLFFLCTVYYMQVYAVFFI